MTNGRRRGHDVSGLRHDCERLLAECNGLLRMTVCNADAGRLPGARSGEVKPPGTMMDPAALKTVIPQAIAAVARARVRWLEPVQEEMDRIITAAHDRRLTDAELAEFIRAAAENMPDLFARMDQNALADALENATGLTVEKVLSHA